MTFIAACGTICPPESVESHCHPETCLDPLNVPGRRERPGFPLVFPDAREMAGFQAAALGVPVFNRMDVVSVRIVEPLIGSFPRRRIGSRTCGGRVRHLTEATGAALDRAWKAVRAGSTLGVHYFSD